MTTLLETALKRAAKHPASLQDEIASEIMEELDWIEGKNTSVIDQMAAQALAEFDAGETTEAGWDEL